MKKLVKITSILLCIIILNFPFKTKALVYDAVDDTEAASYINDQPSQQISYFDIDGDGVQEKIIKNISKGTGQSLNYYIYKNNKLIWSRKDLYKGKLLIQKGTIIEIVPIYSVNESNSSPSKIGQTTYKYSNNIFIKTDYKEISFVEPNNNLKQGTATYYKNPSKNQIEKIIDNIADEKGIPRVILKAIAWQESRGYDSDNDNIANWRQFVNGAPLIGYDGIGIGIMQISDYNPKDTSPENIEYINRLKYDIEFNIREGANILLKKWTLAYAGAAYKTPKVGDMTSDYLEHWYYSIWAYNSYSNRNNPANNYENAYQTLIIKHVNNVFNTTMTDLYLYNKTLFTIDVLPRTDISEINSASLNKATLKDKSQNTNYVMDANGVSLRDDNMNIISSYNKGTVAKIISGRIYVNGYSRYKIQVGDKIGSVADMYLKPGGNLNNDIISDIYDLSGLSKNLGKSINIYNAQDLRRLDVNNDNIIDIKDIAIACSNYNKSFVK